LLLKIDMEPARKRQRVSHLSIVGEDRPDENFDPFNRFYNRTQEGGSNGHDMNSDEEVEASDCVDPDAELHYTRERLDQKLKLRFEEIFEKYGKDFTGIGDEIDLRTGEVVVDNGHLVEMVNERDAGDATSGQNMLRAFTVEPEMLGFDDEDEVEEEDEDDSQYDGMKENGHDEINPEDMEEDDMIFFQPRTAPSGTLNGIAPAHPAHREPMGPPPLPARFRNSQHVQTPDRAIPTIERSDGSISTRIGPQMGRKIERYVSQQRVLSDVVVEPAWRTPGLAIATPGKRPIIKSILLQPDANRPESPGGSLWALSKSQNRPRRGPTGLTANRFGRDDAGLEKGSIVTEPGKAPKQVRREAQSEDVPAKARAVSDNFAVVDRHSQNLSAAVLTAKDPHPDVQAKTVATVHDSGDGTENPGVPHYDYGERVGNAFVLRRSYDQNSGSEIPPRRRLVRFTEEDDQVVQAWAAHAKGLGYSVWSYECWKLLEDMVCKSLVQASTQTLTADEEQ
jgi:hypothetical protein